MISSVKILITFTLALIWTIGTNAESMASSGDTNKSRFYFDTNTEVMASQNAIAFISNGFLMGFLTKSGQLIKIGHGDIIKGNSDKIYVLARSRLYILDGNLKQIENTVLGNTDKIMDIKFSDRNLIIQKYSGECMYLESYSIMTKTLIWSSKDSFCAPFSAGDTFSYFVNNGKVYGVGKYGASYMDSYSSLIDASSGRVIDIYSFQMGVESKNPLTHELSEEFLLGLPGTSGKTVYPIQINCNVSRVIKGSQETQSFRCSKYSFDVVYNPAGTIDANNPAQYIVIRSRK